MSQVSNRDLQKGWEVYRSISETVQQLQQQGTILTKKELQPHVLQAEQQHQMQMNELLGSVARELKNIESCSNQLRQLHEDEIANVIRNQTYDQDFLRQKQLFCQREAATWQKFLDQVLEVKTAAQEQIATLKRYIDNNTVARQRQQH